MVSLIKEINIKELVFYYKSVNFDTAFDFFLLLNCVQYPLKDEC